MRVFSLQKLANIAKISKILRFLFKNPVVSVRFRMKSFGLVFALFCVMVFFSACGSSSKSVNQGDEPDSGETVTDNDTADDNDPSDDSEPSDTEPDNPDNPDTTPDDSDTTDSMPDEEVVTTPCDPNPCWFISAATGKCTEKGETYECECRENYTWNNGDCVGNTQQAACEELPENAVWNSVGEITQQWNWSRWIPSTIGVYNEEASTTECRFKCKDKYEWDGAKCAVFIPKCNAENADKTCKDYETGYIWSAQSPEKLGQENIVTYCEEELKTDNLSWRTPTIDELRKIVRNCDKTKFGGTCPVSVEYFDYNTYCKPNLDDCNGCDPEEGIEYSIFGTKKGEGNDFSLWSSTQAQENSIMYYYMTFSSDIHMAAISANHTGTRNIRCLGSGKCPEHYELNGNFECVPATKEIMCSDLPENAVGNPLLNDTITQTWDVDSGQWIPANTKYEYCENKNPYKCCFQCYSNYRWDSATEKCLQKTRQAKCEGLPANAEWNSSGEITQTLWSNDTWLPQNNGVYDTNPSTEYCHFKCKDGFWWNGTRCASKTKTVPCEGLPASAEWNTVSQITQTRSDETGTWSPSNEGVYNEEASTTECRFKCKKNYEWNGSGCGSTVRSTSCTHLPSNAEWNTVSQITQTKDSTTGEWLPSSEGVYNETASTEKCVFKCKNGYAWDNVESMCRKIDCGSYIENAGVCKDIETGLMWIPYFPDIKVHSKAVDFCANLTVGGYSNWRLPTLNELRTTIRNCNKTASGGSCPITNACSSIDCFGDDLYNSLYDDNGSCGCTEDKTGIYSKFNLDGAYYHQIWSSTLERVYHTASNTSYSRFWYVNYDNAQIGNANDTSNILVRCVR